MSKCDVINCFNIAEFDCRVKGDYDRYCPSHYLEWKKTATNPHDYTYTLPKITACE